MITNRFGRVGASDDVADIWNGIRKLTRTISREISRKNSDTIWILVCRYPLCIVHFLLGISIKRIYSTTYFDWFQGFSCRPEKLSSSSVMTLLLTQYKLLRVPTAEGCLLIDLEVGYYFQSNMKIFLESTHTIISLTTPIEIIQTV